MVRYWMIPELGKYLPDLKFLQLRTLEGLEPKHLQHLLGCHKLEVIEIVETRANRITPVEMQELANAAKDLLAQLPTDKDVRRVVKVRQLRDS